MSDIAEFPTMVSLDAQMAEAGRELAMRRRTYPMLIAQRKLDHDTAQHQIRCMESILATLRQLKSKGGK